MDSKPGLAYSLLVVYSRDCTVELIPSKFEHMMPFDTNMGWNMEKFQKKRLAVSRFILQINLFTELNKMERYPHQSTYST
jgi:hypothetical protein